MKQWHAGRCLRLVCVLNEQHATEMFVARALHLRASGQLTNNEEGWAKRLLHKADTSGLIGEEMKPGQDKDFENHRHDSEVSFTSQYPHRDQIIYGGEIRYSVELERSRSTWITREDIILCSYNLNK